MEPDIEKALSLTMEIEGLLHLLQHRDLSTLPQTVKTLLTSKSTELSRLLSFGIDNKVQNNIENFEMQKVDSPAPDAGISDDERLAETVVYEQEEDSQPEAGSPDAYQTKLDEAQAEEDEADTESAEIDKARKDYYSEILAKRSEGSRLIQKFTLNDRYRFTRELFGGSTTAFNTILEEISTFTTIDEVKDYLTEKQSINLTAGSGKEFFAVIVSSFGR